jgi:glucokinase
MIFLTMGTGLGAGMVLNGQLYRGSSEMAGEFGHVRLTASGPVGHNKAGSVEGWVSGSGMAQAAMQTIRTATQKGVPTSLATVAETGVLTPRHIAAAAWEGDAIAKEIIHSTGERLGEALAVLVDILNPECIVMGGLAMRLGDALLAPARLIMEREALRVSVHSCRLVPAALGENIGDVAALCVAAGLEVQQPFLETVQP